MLTLIQAGSLSASESAAESILFIFLALAAMGGWWIYRHPEIIRSGAREGIHWGFAWLIVIVIALLHSASAGLWMQVYDTHFRTAVGPHNFPPAEWMRWDWEALALLAAVGVILQSEQFVPAFMRTSVYSWHQKTKLLFTTAAKLFVVLVIIPAAFVFLGSALVNTWIPPSWPMWVRYALPVVAGITAFILIIDRLFQILTLQPDPHLRGVVVYTTREQVFAKLAENAAKAGKAQAGR